MRLYYRYYIFLTLLSGAACTSTTGSAPPKELTAKNKQNMKLNAGIVTSKLAETKIFYTTLLNFGVSFENEFYLLMHTPDEKSEISFLLPEHPSQRPLFQKPFQGQCVYLTIEVEDVDKVYAELKNKNVDIKIDLRDEPWGDRHFAIQDPNGIGIDVVQYSAPHN
jgi:catechol 2,3-dioxygenase-like lactoylglutathione lyase family enzyme